MMMTRGVLELKRGFNRLEAGLDSPGSWAARPGRVLILAELPPQSRKSVVVVLLEKGAGGGDSSHLVMKMNRSPCSEELSEESLSSVVMFLRGEQLSLGGDAGGEGGFTLGAVVAVASKATFTLKRGERVKLASTALSSA